jgi:hypothetical protein
MGKEAEPNWIIKLIIKMGPAHGVCGSRQLGKKE